MIRLYDKMKQLYLTIMIQRDRHYFVLVDIRRALYKTFVLLSTKRMERDEILRVVSYRRKFKTYLDIFSNKKMCDGSKAIVSLDVYTDINDFNIFSAEILERSDNYRR